MKVSFSCTARIPSAAQSALNAVGMRAQPVWPSYVRTLVPSSRSHSRTTQSAEPLASTSSRSACETISVMATVWRRTAIEVTPPV